MPEHYYYEDLTHEQQEWIGNYIDSLMMTPLSTDHPLAYCAPELIEQRSLALAMQALHHRGWDINGIESPGNLIWK